MTHDFVLTNHADLPDGFLLLRAVKHLSDFWNSGDKIKSAVIESTLVLVNLPSLFTLLKIFRTVFLTDSI